MCSTTIGGPFDHTRDEQLRHRHRDDQRLDGLPRGPAIELAVTLSQYWMAPREVSDSAFMLTLDEQYAADERYSYAPANGSYTANIRRISVDLRGTSAGSRLGLDVEEARPDQAVEDDGLAAEHERAEQGEAPRPGGASLELGDADGNAERADGDEPKDDLDGKQ